MRGRDSYKVELLPPERDAIFYTYNPVITDEKVALIKDRHNEEWVYTFSDDVPNGTDLYCKHWKWICLAVLFLGGIGVTVYYLLRKN
jgi:hypothetical protein